MRDGERLAIDLPPWVARILERLNEAGEAVLVGGCVRDLVRGDRPGDWDVATSLPPEEVVRRFEATTWRNPFGTVSIRPGGDAPVVEVTTYRSEGAYRDRRRPEAVRWGASLEEDLARRDFAFNAMAWRPLRVPFASPTGATEGRLVDPHGGARDLAAGLVRGVGDPDQRMAEDALRMLRAVRFAARFGFRIEAATEAAIRAHAHEAAHLSGERVREELLRMLRDGGPLSVAVGHLERLGLLAVLLPELSALRGVPQDKALPGDALDHSLRTADALPPSDPILRLAGLLHDLGKATTLADGHFIGHEREGAALAEHLMRRLRFSRDEVARVARLVGHHMFAYSPEWTDAAVRRFIRRVGPDLLADLLALRRADNAASGVDEPRRGLDELRDRVGGALAHDPIAPHQLAVDGHVLVAELGLAPGPMVGELLRQLMEAVTEAPALNRREALLELARERLRRGADGARTHRQASEPAEASD